MANQEQVIMLCERHGVKHWNEWRAENLDVEIDLNDADFEGIDLNSANLTSANLNFANLNSASLTSANLTSASLASANLSSANLESANLEFANLESANLNSANLESANLESANLDSANLASSNLNFANLAFTNLEFANLYSADVYSANLNRANLESANLSSAKLENANLYSANLYSANLNSANLYSANFNSANLYSANLALSNLNFANLASANLEFANLYSANLYSANFNSANLECANLSSAKLENANLHRANLECANLNSANLNSADLECANLECANLHRANLQSASLYRANLESANLNTANLNTANLENASLNNADLSNTCLRIVTALGTSFKGANLTGACIEDWHINSETNFEGLVCDYIYLKWDRENNEFIERRPSDPNRNFASGEFTKLFQKARETIDLIFSEGIDWQAFLTSYQHIQLESDRGELDISAIEKTSDGSFVIRVAVPDKIDKGNLEAQFYDRYQGELQRLEGVYQRELQAKDREIDIYRRQSTDMLELAKLAAGRPITVEAKAVAEGNTQQSGNFGIGQMSGGTIQGGARVAGVYNKVEKQNLQTAASEIQFLLDQLNTNYGNSKIILATEVVRAVNNNTKLKTLLTSLQAGSIVALEELLNHPAASFVIPFLDTWHQEQLEG